jgi:hypothetical protein
MGRLVYGRVTRDKHDSFRHVELEQIISISQIVK